MPSEPDKPTLLNVRAAVTLIAALSLLVLPAASWRFLASDSAFGAALDVAGVVAALACVIAALAVRSDAARTRLDMAILGVGVAWYATSRYGFLRSTYSAGTGVDETFTGQRALRVLAAGHNPYAANFPGVAHLPGPTYLLGGGFATHYSYPPLTLEVGWFTRHIWTPLGEPWVLAALALLITVGIGFVALPKAWRVLVVPVVFGFGLLDGFVALGFPAIVALPFLCVVAWRWTATGAGGALGRRGSLQAACLGLAASAHQLAWFVAAFVVVALWTVRRGELTRQQSALVLARYLGIAVGVFAVLNAPFALTAPHAWLERITEVFTQQAIPFGTGLIVITLGAIGHTANFAYFTYAATFAFLGLLAIEAVGIRRLAFAVPVLPAVMFLFSARSNLLYIVFFVPVLLVWAGTADRAAIERSQPLRWLPTARLALNSTPRRTLAAAAALVPALVFATLALFSSAPLSIAAQSATLTADGRLTQVVLDVTNRSDSDIRPRFTVNLRAQVEPRWHLVGSGAVVLHPGQHATLTIAPGAAFGPVQKQLFVYAVSADPGSLSSAVLRLRADQIRTDTTQSSGAASNVPAQQCAIQVLTAGGTCTR